MVICIGLWLFLSKSIVAYGQDLDYIREQYEKAASDKDACEKMISLLKEPKSNVHLAYLGGFQALWAGHATNPIVKLNTFNKGKKNIDHAAREDTENVDIRMIRLSVQQNSPSFLNYNDYIAEDRKYLEKNKANVRSEVLLKIINSLLFGR